MPDLNILVQVPNDFNLGMFSKVLGLILGKLGARGSFKIEPSDQPAAIFDIPGEGAVDDLFGDVFRERGYLDPPVQQYTLGTVYDKLELPDDARLIFRREGATTLGMIMRLGRQKLLGLSISPATIAEIEAKLKKIGEELPD